MSDMIFYDENKSCKFDFSSALWATDELQEIFQRSCTPLSDVDFVIESERELIFIEYKNSNIKQAVKPETFIISRESLITKLARKYYDSIMFFNAMKHGQGKIRKYVCILEAVGATRSNRKQVRERLYDKLPFDLQKKNNFSERLIDRVEVLSIDEWNELYHNFPIEINHKGAL